jgi:glycosyltransferase involved in cell wall biosynthesis
MNERRLLICADWFAPGVRAGGPIRSLVNLSQLLASDVQVRVLTSNRDLGESAPYPGISVDQWVPWQPGIEVFYGTGASRRTEFDRVLASFQPQAVYLNSMFSPAGTLWPLWRLARQSAGTQVILAPRGMLKPTALDRKGWKKKPVMSVLRRLGLTRGVVFHASSPDEIQEVEHWFPGNRVAHLPMVPQCPLEQVPDGRQSDGMLRLCCVGRVHPIKNVHIALQALRQLTVPVVLRVLGPAEDAVYLEECQRIVASLPTVVRVEFCGVQSEAEVRRSLIESDAMILPTQGENFGHAIFESLAVGTPVVISDCTIWRDLVRQEAGWDLPLTAPEAFGQVLEQLAVMSGDERQRLRRGALRLAQGFVASHRFREDYLKLFFDQA